MAGFHHPDLHEGDAGTAASECAHPQDRNFWVAAIVLLMGGGVILSISGILGLPDPLLIAGGILTLIGLTLIPFLGFRNAREQGHSFFGSIGKGLLAMWRLFWQIVF